MSALTPVAARITGLREARGLTRTRLSQLSGVPLRTLEEWEAVAGSRAMFTRFMPSPLRSA